MDETIRDCCLEIYGCDLLRDQEFPDNLKDESLTSERVQLKISQGGGGLRLTEPRARFLNSMSLALIVFRHAWPSLVSVFGNDSFQGSEEHRWIHFGTGSSFATELRDEWIDLQRRRTDLLDELQLDKPPASILETPVDSFGFEKKKLHKLIMDSLGTLKKFQITQRAQALPPDDARRNSYLAVLHDKIARMLIGGKSRP